MFLSLQHLCGFDLCVPAVSCRADRMGFLLGMACSIGLIVRVMVIYMMVNFGYGVIYTVAVPFFSTDLMTAAVNGVYVGLLFCVFAE